MRLELNLYDLILRGAYIEWIPVDFKRPPAEPAPNWDIHKTKPNPYRPFRWGPYNITMGIRSMDWNEWIGKCPFHSSHTSVEIFHISPMVQVILLDLIPYQNLTTTISNSTTIKPSASSNGGRSAAELTLQPLTAPLNSSRNSAPTSLSDILRYTRPLP